MTITTTTQARKRQAQVAAGVYDGRYKTKVVPDKKKKASKNACRGAGKGTHRFHEGH